MDDFDKFVAECVEEIRLHPEKYPSIAKKAMQKLSVVTTAMLQAQSDLGDEYFKNHQLQEEITRLRLALAQSQEEAGRLRKTLEIYATPADAALRPKEES